MEVWLFRHAETWANRQGRMQSQQNLVLSPSQPTELTPLGQHQAQALGQHLARVCGPPSRIYCSPLVRAQATLAEIQAIWPTAWPGPDACPTEWEPRLMEIELGIFSGLTWPEAQNQFPNLCDRLLQQLDWLPIPGAESPQDCRDRATAFCQTQLRNCTESDRVWIITHAGIMPHLLAVLLGCDRTWGIALDPTALFAFSLNRDRLDRQDINRFNPCLWTIRAFNDLSHLSQLKSD